MVIYRRIDIEEFIRSLAERAAEHSDYKPVNRSFLEPYIEQILTYNLKDFVYYNIEMTSELYASQLFLCLPEIWDDIEVDDVIEISHRLSKEIAFYTLIKFTYKYLEIDMLDCLLSDMSKDRSPIFSKYALFVLENQYNVLIKSEYEIAEYRTDENWGVDLDRWLYIKQRMLLDNRVKPALQDVVKLKKHVDNLLLRYRQ